MNKLTPPLKVPPKERLPIALNRCASCGCANPSTPLAPDPTRCALCGSPFQHAPAEKRQTILRERGRRASARKSLRKSPDG